MLLEKQFNIDKDYKRLLLLQQKKNLPPQVDGEKYIREIIRNSLEKSGLSEEPNIINFSFIEGRNTAKSVRSVRSITRKTTAKGIKSTSQKT